MQKLLLTLLAVVAFKFSCAQSFKFSIGSGVPWIAQPIGTNSTSTSTTSTNPETGYEVSRSTSMSESVKGSYGAGWNANGAFCYALSENIGLELGIGYIAGKEYATASSYTESQGDIVTRSGHERETSKSRAFMFTPALRFMTQKRTFTPYFLIGPLFGKINLRRSMARSIEENGVTTVETNNTRFKGGISLGLRGAVGASVAVSRKLSLFAEIVFTGMNYYPKESELTRYTINGEDQLSTLTKNVTHTDYVNKVEHDSQQANDDVNRPNRSLRFPVPMSAISASAGVQVKLQ